MSPIVVARHVAYEIANGRELFSDLNISLGPTLTALVGPNGVGKTSLARMLAGELEPTAGTIRRTSAVRLFAQRELPEPITVAECLAIDCEWSPLRGQLLKDISSTALCTELSGGEWMRVRLARTLRDEFLILDEPTNDLDRSGREALLKFLRDRKGGALVISHDRECLALCADVLELSNRGLARFGGGWAAYLQARTAERAKLADALDAAKRERDAVAAHRVEQLSRQEKRNRRGNAAAARGGTPKLLLGARKRRAEASSGKLDVATLQQADEAVRRAHEAFSAIKIDPVMYSNMMSCELPAQKLVAAAHGFNIHLQRWIYRQDLDFTWRGNVRVAVRGANGSGKSTLLKALSGAPWVTRGSLRPGDLLMLYLDQQRRILDDAKSVLENVRAVSSASESEIRNDLARFLFANEAVLQPVRHLSGGERLRAALARAFLGTRQPEVLLLDEPTNNLDLANIEFLEGIVREFRGALIVVSHDEAFLRNCGVDQELIL